MPAFKVTAKQDCGGGKIKKGLSVQVVQPTANTPDAPHIAEAFEKQLGIKVSPSSVYTSYFIIEKL